MNTITKKQIAENAAAIDCRINSLSFIAKSFLFGVDGQVADRKIAIALCPKLGVKIISADSLSAKEKSRLLQALITRLDGVYPRATFTNPDTGEVFTAFATLAKAKLEKGEGDKYAYIKTTIEGEFRSEVGGDMQPEEAYNALTVEISERVIDKVITLADGRQVTTYQKDKDGKDIKVKRTVPAQLNPKQKWTARDLVAPLCKIFDLD